jgi:hypothetical protein
MLLLVEQLGQNIKIIFQMIQKKFVIGVMQFCIDQFEDLLINNLNHNGWMLKKMQFFE